MKTIQNPILRGFNPDPSILRVEDDYYIATSTFEWFPGVLIYHSRDLRHWELAARPLSRASQLDMRGMPASGGVWAPNLSYSNGIFYLLYTVVSSRGTFKDTPNFLVTAPSVEGPWSDPVYLNCSGFDPSLFHDDDGKKWLVNMVWDFRPGHNSFAGIALQAYSPQHRRLEGPISIIFRGSELGRTEGPNLYKRSGLYYLLTAEGGTEYGHAVTVARCDRIDGNYALSPNNPLLTSKTDFSLPLQKAGHGSLVQTQQGDWYMAHLCARPMPRTALSGASVQSVNRCVLGRETALQKVMWTPDGWPVLEGGKPVPQVRVPAPDLPDFAVREAPARDDFDAPVLNPVFQTLRTALDEDMLSLRERPGFLRLKGGPSPSSLFSQALVARRRQHFCCTAQTRLEFDPPSYKQMAGLICYYDTENFFYLYESWDERWGKCLSVLVCDDGIFSSPLTETVSAEGWPEVYLKLTLEYDRLQFFCSPNGQDWEPVGGAFDNSILSDEYGARTKFTGTFVGLCCQDLDGLHTPADFDYFSYVPLGD